MSAPAQTPRTKRTALALVNRQRGQVGDGLLEKLGLEVDFDFSSLTLFDTPIKPAKTSPKAATSSTAAKVQHVPKSTAKTVLGPTKRVQIRTSEAHNETLDKASIPVHSASLACVRIEPTLGTLEATKVMKREHTYDPGAQMKEETTKTPVTPILQKRVIYELLDTPLSPDKVGTYSHTPVLPIVRQQRPRTSPTESDDSDMEWINRQRTPARPRMMAHSDSDSDAGPSQRLKPRRSNDVTMVPARSAAERSKQSANVYIDWEAEDEEKDDEDEDEVSYDIAKHYDSSYGSLKDFIVDDSEEESCCSNTPSPEPIKRSKKGKAKVTQEEILCDSSDDFPEPTSRPALPTQLNPRCSDQDDESDGIYYYSPPPKPYKLPDITDLTLSDSDSNLPSPRANPISKTRPTPNKTIIPALKTPSTRPPHRPSKKDWEAERSRLANSIFAELNRKVFEEKLVGVTIEWNKRLLKTAGMAHSSRKKIADGSQTEQLKIILSEKVLTGKEQILNTVAHEMCHLATWIISDDRRNPHGGVFKSWGRKVMKARPDIEVTTTHSYTIEYKFEWRCSNTACGKIYRRHSKSIDITKSACGRCKGRLEPLFAERAGTAFQAYLKENMANAKLALSKTSHGEVMRALSLQWNTSGPTFDHASHWKALAASTIS